MPLPATMSSGTTVQSGGGSVVLSQSGFDLNVNGNATDVLTLQSQISASVQITAETGSDTSFIGALQGSLDGIVWETVSTKGNLGIGIDSDTATVDIYRYLRVVVTTPNGAPLTARVTILAKMTVTP